MIRNRFPMRAFFFAWFCLVLYFLYEVTFLRKTQELTAKITQRVFHIIVARGGLNSDFSEDLFETCW